MGNVIHDMLLRVAIWFETDHGYPIPELLLHGMNTKKALTMFPITNRFHYESQEFKIDLIVFKVMLIYPTMMSALFFN